MLETCEAPLLVGLGASKFARENGFPEISNDSLVTRDALKALKLFRGRVSNELGTVGAVALDAEGNLAAASSTGGLNGKRIGRVGDSPIVGAGLYADDNAAISLTGEGDPMLRFTTSMRIRDGLKNSRLNAEECVKRVFDDMTATLGGDGGGIVVTKDGEIGVYWNSRRMSWAFMDSREAEKVHYGLEKGQRLIEKF